MKSSNLTFKVIFISDIKKVENVKRGKDRSSTNNSRFTRISLLDPSIY